ncbi:hypothetical protein PUR22_34875 [Mycolicibacterium porcinum]|uniref:hypothetical protein n=1 Tax=Mycolicibacterium porcinum TaxID=39693 RepID=UPI0031F81671
MTVAVQPGSAVGAGSALTGGVAAGISGVEGGTDCVTVSPNCMVGSAAGTDVSVVLSIWAVWIPRTAMTAAAAVPAVQRSNFVLESMRISKNPSVTTLAIYVI